MFSPPGLKRRVHDNIAMMAAPFYRLLDFQNTDGDTLLPYVDMETLGYLGQIGYNSWDWKAIEFP
jgi:hypothetical protein